MSDTTSIAYPAVAGCNTAEQPVAFVRENSGRFIQLAGNMRVEQGKWRTAFKWRELARIDDGVTDWASADFQEAIWYNPRSGQGAHYLGTGVPRIVESADGRMYTIEIRGNEYKVTDISGGVQASDRLTLAWLTQGENYVVRTDGRSQTQIWDGKNPVFVSQGYNTSVKDRSGFPNQAGATVYAGGRFYTTVYGRQVLASDSLHQLNQLDANDILRFTDQSYDYLNIAFFPPADDGDITALGISVNSGYNDSRAQGEVLAMCTGPSVWAIALGIPREQWAEVKMRTSRSKETAATGPNAFYVRDGDILMRTPEGIRSLNLLAREQQSIGTSVIDLGADLSEILDRDNEPYLFWASLINPARWRRMFCTVTPQVSGSKRWHLGYVVANWNPMSIREPSGFAWEGLCTLPKEMGRVIKFLPNRINGKTYVYAILLKPDGTKTIAQILEEDGNHILADGTEVERQWYLLTKKLAPGGQWRDSKWERAMLLLEDMQTDVEITISARTNEDQEFREVAMVAVKVDPLCFPGCGKRGERRISLGPILSSYNSNRWTQFLIRGKGVTTVDFGFQVGNAQASPEEFEGVCVTAIPFSVCPFDPYYPAL